ncbi:MAG: hypothetical protein IPJ34_38190 [Myxococcales bacterium]|nr:hypothetical protein [Myxococcales bacterium]
MRRSLVKYAVTLVCLLGCARTPRATVSSPPAPASATACSGVCAPRVLLAKPGAVYGLAADDHAAVWLTSDDFPITAVRTIDDAGQPYTLATSDAANPLSPVVAVHGGFAYWCTATTVFRKKVRSEAPAESFASTTDGCTALSVDDGRVVYRNGAGVDLAKPVGGGPGVIVPKEQTSVRRRRDAEGVDWDYVVRDGGLSRVRAAGGAPTVLLPPNTTQHEIVLGPNAIYFVVDGTRYFGSGLTECKSGEAKHGQCPEHVEELVSIPLGGGARRTLGADGLLTAVHADARHVYWQTGGIYDNPIVIQRADHAGASTVVVIGAPWSPSRFVYTDARIVFVDQKTGALAAVQK